MVCNLPYNCFRCPELQEHIDKHGPIETDMYFCPIAMGEKALAEKAAV